MNCLLRFTPTLHQQLTCMTIITEGKTSGWIFFTDFLLSASHGSYFQNKPHKWDGEPCALGSYLSMVDPWYNTNISSLGSMILKLAQMVGLDSCFH